MNKRTTIFSYAGLAAFTSVSAIHGQPAGKMNVLLIIADDMRPELGCYGVEDIITPNIDSLAKKATVFHNAYCNIPVSGASRASIFTGMYPSYPDRFTAFDASAEIDCPEALTLSQCFKNNGYYVISNGKVFHNIVDNAGSWSEYPWRLHPDGYGKDWADYNKWELWQNSGSANYINETTKRGPFCESANVPDTAYDDGMVAQKTIRDLQKLKESDKPFFLACGFWKPHLPFNAPSKYWNLYDRNQIKLAENQYRPANLPKQVTTSTEITGYGKFTNMKDEAFQREAKHGYYACVSYVDAQIGLVLKELERLDLAKNTIVVIIGDHGWHLGEHGFWGKHNLMNHATHAPLIVKVPGNNGGNARGIVEFVDIYPTLCDLCGVPAPKKQIQGKSFSPMLQNPEKRIKDYAFIQWGAGCNIVTEKYSFALWSKDGQPVAEMLFNHQNDLSENVNVVSDTTMNKVVEDLTRIVNCKKKQIILNK